MALFTSQRVSLSPSRETCTMPSVTTTERFASSRFADADLARGLALLLLGDFEKGLPEFEWRRKSKKIPVPVPFPQPLWEGVAFGWTDDFAVPGGGIGRYLAVHPLRTAGKGAWRQGDRGM